VQNELLAQNPTTKLRVYAVWLPILGGDSREEWNGTTMPDPRVIHFRDGETGVGQWFASEVDGFQGIAWDVYYLYGPDATWASVPSPLTSSGSTIYGERQALKMQLDAVLEQ
jgi:hypothetical protein